MDENIKELTAEEAFKLYQAPVQIDYVDIDSGRNSLYRKFTKLNLLGVLSTARSSKYANVSVKERSSKMFEEVMQLSKSAGLPFEELVQYLVYEGVSASTGSSTNILVSDTLAGWDTEEHTLDDKTALALLRYIVGNISRIYRLHPINFWKNFVDSVSDEFIQSPGYHHYFMAPLVYHDASDMMQEVMSSLVARGYDLHKSHKIGSIGWDFDSTSFAVRETTLFSALVTQGRSLLAGQLLLNTHVSKWEAMFENAKSFFNFLSGARGYRMIREQVLPKINYTAKPAYYDKPIIFKIIDKWDLHLLHLISDLPIDPMTTDGNNLTVLEAMLSRIYDRGYSSPAPLTVLDILNRWLPSESVLRTIPSVRHSGKNLIDLALFSTGWMITYMSERRQLAEASECVVPTATTLRMRSVTSFMD